LKGHEQSLFTVASCITSILVYTLACAFHVPRLLLFSSDFVLEGVGLGLGGNYIALALAHDGCLEMADFLSRKPKIGNLNYSTLDGF
jgi:hypothetical protein